MEFMSHCAVTVLFSIFIRWCVSLNPHSGQDKPPMYGDYEAQRHWMEITYNLPTEKWYVNSTENDLQYWGLDYPPLTAYHSWLLGLTASKLNGSWVALQQSRGHESPSHKLFMRSTVLLADVLVYIPAVLIYFSVASKSLTKSSKVGCAIVALLYPGLILIDHGHFQYNCISLGLTLWAVIGLCKGHDLLASMTFVMALNYKQMELYHAVPFFCYLLGSCFRGRQNWLGKLTSLGVIVVATFLVCWLPFLKDIDSVQQVVHRLFPFARGLYEDKVANVWCSVSIFFKVKQIFETTTLIKVCLASTALSLLPSSLHLLLRPSLTRFKYAMVNASLGFFLFSFQVHEKSILIVALSVSLLLPQHPFACVWFMLISTFSMLPLLLKDGLLLPFVGTTSLFCCAASLALGTESLTPSPEHKTNKRKRDEDVQVTLRAHVMVKVLLGLSIVGCVALIVASWTVSPPPALPDLFPVMVSVYACAHFLLFLLFFHWRQFSCTDDVTQESHAQSAGSSIASRDAAVKTSRKKLQ